MSSWSPTVEGFRTLFRRPSLSLAEITWRWSFSAVSWLLLLLVLVGYLRTLLVSPRDIFLLRSGIPSLAARALAHILAGSGSRLLLAFLVVGTAATFLWIVLASLGRAATLTPIIESLRHRAALASRQYRRDLLDDASAAGQSSDGAPVSAEAAVARTGPGELRSSFLAILGLNLIRAFLFFVAFFAVVACFVVASQLSSSAHPHPLLAFFSGLTLLAVTFFFVSTLNWLLSLAALFAVRGAAGPVDALRSAVSFCRDRFAAVGAVGFWFGLAHLTLFVIATSVVGFPLSLAGVIPPGFILLAGIVITAAYFALADGLYIGRLAGYAAILEAPALPAPRLRPLPIPSPAANSVSAASPPTPAGDTQTAIDADELILSDVAVEETQGFDRDELILSDQPRQDSDREPKTND
jgi:hypothetical protein